MSPDCPNSPHISSLTLLCISTICSHISKYPPYYFSILSEYEWENIVEYKYNQTSPKVRTNQLHSLDSSILLSDGRTTPALSPLNLKEIEDSNTSLSYSSVTDVLLWKDCVNYKFKKEGISRPLLFICPWPMLVNRVKYAGKELMELLDTNYNIKECFKVKKEYCLQVLCATPMCIPLLEESGVGKAVSQFVKVCKYNHTKKISHVIPSYFHSVWEETMVMPTHLKNNLKNHKVSMVHILDRLLFIWRLIYQAESSDENNNDEIINQTWGKKEKTTKKQHLKDIQKIQKCSQWRHLYKLLEERELSIRLSHGRKIRNSRREMVKNRSKISTNVRVKKLIRDCRNFHDPIESYKENNKGFSCNRKMKQIRKESKLVSTRLTKSMIIGQGMSITKKLHPMQQKFGSSLCSIARIKRRSQKLLEKEVKSKNSFVMKKW